MLDPPAPHERAGVMRDEAAFLLDRLLGRVARGRGALDVAIGEGLASLEEGDRLLQLGYSCLGDYARERLGIGESSARGMAKLARELRVRPLLADAVRRGEVSARKALAVLPVARGELQEAWVARARSETVRALEAAVRAAGAGDGVDDAPWERILVPLTAEGRAKLDQAMALAGKLLGAASPKWQRLEAICQEFLGAHPVQPSEDEGRDGFSEPVQRWLEAAKEALEIEMGRWAFLDEATKPQPVAAPDGAACESDPRRIDEELRGFAAMREGWDELVGHLSMLLLNVGLCTTCTACTEGGFASRERRRTGSRGSSGCAHPRSRSRSRRRTEVDRRRGIGGRRADGDAWEVPVLDRAP